MAYLMLLVVFISNIMQAMTGFAGTMLAMPASIQIIGLKSASALLNVMGLTASLLIAVPGYRHVDWRCMGRIMLGMLPGMVVGIFLAGFVNFPILKVFYGLFITGIALWRLLAGNSRTMPRWARGLMIPLAGVIHGLFVSGGSLLVLYAAEALPDKRRFRATLSMCWVVLNGILMVTHIANASFSAQTTWLTLLCLLALLPAIWLGNRLHARISQNVFLKISYILLIVSGLSLLLRF